MVKLRCIWFLILSACLCLALGSCGDEIVHGKVSNFDIILVIGQSNTHYGSGLDKSIDRPKPGIYQLGRNGNNNFKILIAAEPLEHHTQQQGKIGFALTFANAYRDFLKSSRNILIIPGGHSGTGFADNRWNPGDDLYNDAIIRAKHVLKDSTSKLVAILWHQGETDTRLNNINYQTSLDKMINSLRRELAADSTPFILGGMNPYWTKRTKERSRIQEVIKKTPFRIANTGYADPEAPFEIIRAQPDTDSTHFDAQGQRELGKRYFEAYLHTVDPN